MQSRDYKCNAWLTFLFATMEIGLQLVGEVVMLNFLSIPFKTTQLASFLKTSLVDAVEISSEGKRRSTLDR